MGLCNRNPSYLYSFLIMPTIGAMADISGSRMKLFKSFAYGGSIFASTFYFAQSGDVVLTLLIYFLAQIWICDRFQRILMTGLF